MGYSLVLFVFCCFFFVFLVFGFFLGPYSLNGYRVRVYRQDSATQWFTGIITHHDLFTRTMIVMNDQVNSTTNIFGNRYIQLKFSLFPKNGSIGWHYVIFICYFSHIIPISLNILMLHRGLFRSQGDNDAKFISTLIKSVC